MTAAPAPHGDRRRFLAGCPCTACRRANAAYCKAYRVRRALDPASLGVPAAPVAAHVEQLLETMSREAIAAAAGCSRSVIARLPDQEKVKAATAAALLAVRPATSVGRHMVSAAGSRRRLQALMTLGYCPAELARSVGVTRQNLAAILSGTRKSMFARTADEVRRVYDELSMRPAPAGATRYQRAHRSRTLARAATARYAPPLAWDDETIDDPHAEPVGHLRDAATPHLDLDDWQHLVDGGVHPLDAATRCGVSIAAVEQAARRHHRPDILTALAGARSAMRRAA